MKMLRYRIHQDHDYYEAVMTKMFGNPNSTENDYTTSGQVMMLSLNNCYNKIELYDAEQMAESDYINALTPQNKELLNFEEWEKYLKIGKNDTIEIEINKTRELVEMIKEEDFYMNGFDNNEEQYEEEEKNESEENKEDIVEDGTIDLLGMMEMNSTIKNIIGIGLIIMIFLVVIYGLRKIADLKVNKDKNKKKKKIKSK